MLVFEGAEADSSADDLAQVQGSGAGPNQCLDLLVERDQADRVLLVQHQPSQRGGNALGVLELAQRGGAALVTHAFADVQDDVANQVRLVLMLLQIELVGAAERLPVDIAQDRPLAHTRGARQIRRKSRARGCDAARPCSPRRCGGPAAADRAV